MYTTLIESDKLQSIINQPSTLVFDCRHELINSEYGIKSYKEGHLPNALFASMDDVLSQKPNGKNGRHPLPEISAFTNWLSVCGVTQHTQVIAYDDAGGAYASRLWCLLKWLGHDAVAVLNGGLQAWINQGGDLVLDTPKLNDRKAFEPKVRDIFVDADFILQHLDDEQTLIIDARSNDRFHGQNESIDPIGGHIPGAINRFFKDNLNSTGKFLDAKDLKKIFEGIMGNVSEKTIIHQCGSGVTACHNLLAMEVAGLENSKVYPGSWSEWISDPSRPIATD
ncbi:MAG: sulfurtransferase [Proteobacteria bacterium]|nr:sulfurtransferase [Pseudomonadota bacterium]MDA1330910.1 sulfurtransferase [Pseudomonadota bacterium]